MRDPLQLVERVIPRDWIDEYGHMNLAHYVTLCDEATYAFWNVLNGAETLETRNGHEYAVLETHVCYLDELAEGEGARVTTQLLASDLKRYVLFHRVFKLDGTLAATNEVKVLGFNLISRRSEAFQPAVLTELQTLQAAHDGLDRPEVAGQGIVLGRRPG